MEDSSPAIINGGAASIDRVDFFNIVGLFLFILIDIVIGGVKFEFKEAGELNGEVNMFAEGFLDMLMRK
ncbi:MAG: hypothetical protein S4CHLAM102_11750 [Chlamydiia bacterium]|nr:hypothetical protein [Chlamydiia bacterium]